MVSSASKPMWVKELGSAEPLAISLEPVDGESLIGMIARATRENVLWATRIILGRSGYSAGPGSVGMKGIDYASLIALQLGCSIDDVRLRCHPYLLEGARSVIEWGGSGLYRGQLIVKRRRVSPASLEVADHHRADWMNALLPYCPESLELLIDTCVCCGSPQLWRNSWGIGYCDQWSCRKRLEHPTGEILSGLYAHQYRRFAALVAADPKVRRAAIDRLPPALKQIPAAALANFIPRLGMVFRSTSECANMKFLNQIPPAELAAGAAMGMSLIDDWPRGLRTFTGDEFAKRERQGNAATKTFLDNFRELGRAWVPEQAKAIRDAVPEIYSYRGGKWIAMRAPVMSSKAAAAFLRMSIRDLVKLREADLIEHRSTGPKSRLLTLYDRSAVEELARKRNASATAASVGERLGVPFYAVEQLSCLGYLEEERDSCIKLLNPTLRVVTRSVDELLHNLREVSAGGTPPSDAVPLRTALKVMGGCFKPWGPIVDVLQQGSLPFWFDGEKRFADSVRVMLSDFVKFRQASFDYTEYPEFLFKDSLSQRDVIEVWNISAPKMMHLMKTDVLKWRRIGLALETDSTAVLEVARQVISYGEIALKMGVMPTSARARVNRKKIPRVLFGVSREKFDLEFPEYL